MSDDQSLATIAPAQAEPALQSIANTSPLIDVAKLTPNAAAGYLMLGTEHWQNLQSQCAEMVKGGALHSSYDSPAKAAAVALKGIEMGIPLSSAWSGMRIIDGEITVLGKLALRLIYQRACPMGAVCKRLQFPEEERKLKAGWLMARPGDEPEPFVFTMEDAKSAGLTRLKTRKGEWIDTPAYKKYPERMLPWRALAYGASYIFADILQGCLIAEEMSHKDPDFIDTQLVEAGEAPADKPKARQEINSGHPRVKVLGAQVLRLAGMMAEREVADDSSKDRAAIEAQAKAAIWDEMLGIHKPAKAEGPTLSEVEAMIQQVTVRIDRMRREG